MSADQCNKPSMSSSSLPRARASINLGHQRNADLPGAVSHEHE
jgi:hypothetical protein